MSKLANILAQATRLSRLKVMAGKVVERFRNDGSLSRSDNAEWLRQSVVDYAAVASHLDSSLWEESKAVAGQLQAHAERVLSRIDIDLGGGGIYPLLYFLTRYVGAETVVETGVAAGYSSWAFLKALDANGGGKLYSSDFPYFRIEDPERYIGVLVEDNMKEGWELYIEGDRNNLPRIMSKVASVDIAHFDSDKSYSGREYFMSQVGKKLSSDGLIVMDDIQDNSFFHDYVTKNGVKQYMIFEFGGKYIGLIGDLRTELSSGVGAP